MMGVFWELMEASGGGDVEKVLASTTKAYSRKPYGEKAWKAAAEYLVKQYGVVDAVKIMHHKAMRRAQDAASKNDVRSLVASVKSTVSTWPVKDILADIGDSVGLAEAVDKERQHGIAKTIGDGSEREAAIANARVERSFHDAWSSLRTLRDSLSAMSKVSDKSKDTKFEEKCAAVARKIDALNKQLGALQGEFTEAFEGSKTQSLAQRGMDKISPDDV